jgi:hypothetical protein
LDIGDDIPEKAMTARPTPRPIIRLDWPFNADPPALHCPRTGEIVVSDGEDEVDQPASPYVTFVYPEVVGDFVYLRDDLKVRMDATRAEIAAAGGRPRRPQRYRAAAGAGTPRRGADGLRTAHQRHGLRPRQQSAVGGV